MAAIATSTIAVTIALIAPVCLDSLRSFRLVPQRLQKLSPGAIGLAQPEQYISDPLCEKDWRAAVGALSFTSVERLRVRLGSHQLALDFGALASGHIRKPKIDHLPNSDEKTDYGAKELDRL